MARPKKEYSARRNGNSLQFYEGGEYCGSLSLIALCELAKAEKAKNDILAQVGKTHSDSL